MDRSIVNGNIDLGSVALENVANEVTTFSDRVKEDPNKDWELQGSLASLVDPRVLLTWVSRHTENMTACLYGLSLPFGSLSHDTDDHRFFFVERTAGYYVGRYTCGVARDAMARYLQSQQVVVPKIRDIHNTLSLNISNASSNV